jgi:hypothetical protein
MGSTVMASTMIHTIIDKHFSLVTAKGRSMLDQTNRLELKIAIIRAGKKQYQIADELGLTEEAFSKFMRGRRTLPADKLVQLQELLGMELLDVPA